jgi:hypothetical protein
VRRDDLATLLEFDALGRLTQRQSCERPASDQPWKTLESEQYAYDGNGRLVLAQNAASRLQWFHDAAGNPTREHHHYLSLATPRVAVWRHEYDVLNQLRIPAIVTADSGIVTGDSGERDRGRYCAARL